MLNEGDEINEDTREVFQCRVGIGHVVPSIISVSNVI